MIVVLKEFKNNNDSLAYCRYPVHLLLASVLASYCYDKSNATSMLYFKACKQDTKPAYESRMSSQRGRND